MRPFCVAGEETRLVAVPLRAVQLLVGEFIDVDVGPTQVAVASPPHGTLGGGDIQANNIKWRFHCGEGAL